MSKKPVEDAADTVVKEASPEIAEEGNQKSDADAIRKVKDEIAKLPSIWIAHPTLKEFFAEMFALDNLKKRVKQYGIKTLVDNTVIPRIAREYIYTTDTVLSLLAPNTAFTKASNMIRNIALMDSLVDDITGKIERSSELDSYNTISSVLKNIKDCPIRLSEYYIDIFHDVPMGGMFLISMAAYPVGSVIELRSRMFKRNKGESDTIHCKLVYRTAIIEEDKYGYIIHGTESHFAVIAEIQEYNMLVFMYLNTSNDRYDLSIRRIFPGAMSIYGLYRKREDYFGNNMSWCRALPFSMIDFTKYVCHVGHGGVGVYKREELEYKTRQEVFDKKTEQLVHRIVNADMMGCSRSYALVGIPGTGKSFIMNKIVKDNKDAAVIIPCLPDEGFGWDYRQYLQNAITAISNSHIYIMLDDFDKYMSDDENSGKTSQELIFFFDFLHTECPGGVDADGNPRKTFTLVATMNNPKTLANAIIKRSERFDEVIEIGLPQSFIYGKRLNMIKDDGDRTNFDSIKFRLLYWYMRRKVITLADIGNIYAIMKTHRNKECINCTYGVRDLMYAIRFIQKNRKSASKEYAI